MVRIGVHTHNLCLHFFRTVRKVDTVPQRLTHLSLAISSRKSLAGFIVREHYIWLYKYIAIYEVKLSNYFTSLLYHRLLILAYRYMSSLKCGDICCLAYRISKESNRNTGFEVSQLYLGLYGWVSLKS